VMLVGGFLLTHLTAGVSDWELWSWMLILGLGIGPAMAGYTVVVQNAVPTNRLGVATSTLTFLRQIGASVGLAAAGTIFSSSFANRLPTNLAEEGVPQPVILQMVKLSGVLQNVGNGRALLEHLLPGPLQPLIPKVIAGANNASSRPPAPASGSAPRGFGSSPQQSPDTASSPRRFPSSESPSASDRAVRDWAGC